MNVEYINDTGNRHEWRCVHCEADYVVTFHYLDEAWSVQRIRADGQREIIDRHEADDVLDLFPREKAMSLTERTRADAGQDLKIPNDRESLGADPRTRSEADKNFGADAETPAA